MTRLSLCLLLALNLVWADARAEPTTAEPKVEVLGVFAGKALLRIDGQRHLLREGEHQAGVRLVGTDGDRVRLEIGGKVRELGLNERISGRFKAPASRTLTLYPDAQGMYSLHGSINGYATEFLVDTGASLVALNQDQARRLGLEPERGRPVRVQTASGETRAYLVTLDELRVGEIVERGVEAMVLEGGAPEQALLGMSFLSRIEIHRRGSAMLLRQLQ